MNISILFFYIICYAKPERMEGIMIGLNLTNPIVCPVCKGINFSTISEGMLFKKNVLTCNNCGTVMEQSGKDEKSKFKVRKVGEEYSNVDRLFKDKTFTIPELKSHELPIVTDAQLEEYAMGNLEGLTIHMKGDEPPDIILKKNEKIVFMLSPIDYLEERSKRVSGRGQGYSFRVAKGVWYRTSQFRSEYADTITKLDSGVMAFTNKRYIFLGNTKNIDQPLASLTSINPFADGVAFVRSGKQRTEFFSGNYHWPLMSSIIIGLVKNASDK
jgi:DNA-directed RNA polymerase subunit M/transcription elongation factor TFIIS